MKKIKLIRLDEDVSDQSIYSKARREEMLEEDEMDPVEEGFMKGWDEADF